MIYDSDFYDSDSQNKNNKLSPRVPECHSCVNFEEKKEENFQVF